MTGQWPLSNKLYAVGRYDYSIQESRGTQTVLGLEYKGDCCWAARVVMQRYAVSARETNKAMFFQLELSGLGASRGARRAEKPVTVEEVSAGEVSAR